MRKQIYGLASLFLAVLGFFILAACGGEELTREQAMQLQASALDSLLEKAESRPGGQDYEIGKVGGEWVTSINSDPKTFNTLVARDGDTRAVIDPLFEYLAEYDVDTREFIPNIASFRIEADEQADTLKVIYTLRDDLYWTLPGQNIEDAVKVTSDDVIYWYDEIDGDEELQLPGYPGQFIEMPDGTSERISISRIDDRSFAFNIPRIIANPILSTNMTFGPRHIYEPAKKEGGSGALLNLFSIDTDVTTIPSIGMFHLVEYRQGVRVVMQRNPHYWKKDDSGNSYPYVERVVYRILPDKNAEYLLFLEGARDSYSVRAEDLVDLLEPEAPDYAVINGGQSLGATFFTFNQNPKSMDPIKHAWFSQTEFRQAMSCVLNRQRIADVVHRGLAEPAVHFFALANPMFDPSIELEYQYNPQKAVDLLASIDIRPDENGRMRDADGNLVEFSLVVGAENNQGIDTCAIFSDELDEIGIKARVTPVDFQALTEMLLTTYDWDVVHVALGANYWPEGGSNVWPSNGNFHLWHPLQSSPATDWEAKIDQLYNKGRFTLDDQLRKEIYDEYQRIMLEQLPVIYTVHPLSFLAVRNKWGNTSYDTLRGMELFPIYLKDEQ